MTTPNPNEPQTIQDHAEAILKEHPQGLTKPEILEKISDRLGKPVSDQSLRLADLAFDHKIARTVEQKPVTVVQSTEVFHHKDHWHLHNIGQHIGQVAHHVAEHMHPHQGSPSPQTHTTVESD